MTSEMVRLALSTQIATIDVQARLKRLLSIFHVIESGELLAALPDCPLARSKHSAALNLLAIVEIELNSLCDELKDGIRCEIGDNYRAKRYPSV